MDAAIKSRLPPSVQALVDKIEAFAGLEIRVEQQVGLVRPNEPADTLATETTHDRAVIRCENLELINPNGVLHELLHIERWWLEGVPQVYPAQPDPARIAVTGDIENSLEHLIVVPREKNYGFDPSLRWNENYRHRWAWPPNYSVGVTEWAKKKNCLIGWLGTANLVTDPEVRKLGKTFLGNLGHMEKAKRLNEKVKKALASKQEMVRAVVDALGPPITRNELVLLYLDVRNRRAVRAQL